MPLPNAVHKAQPWRVHEITAGFRLEDVWQLPTPGGREDFPQLVDLFTSIDPAHDSPLVVRVLFAVRMKLGELFGWDDHAADPASPPPTIADRLPADLRGTDAGRTPAAFAFRPLFRTDDEYAAELANKTMHGIVHLGWAPDANAARDGGYTGQFAIYVKPNGLLGEAYMAAIKPFRYLFVYPQLLRQVGRAWQARPSQATSDSAL